MGGGIGGPRFGGTFFRRRPDRWVWVLFLGSLVVFTASMLTLREGLRFVSRPLDPEERAIVRRALELWEELGTPDDREGVARARELLARDQLRAMDQETFRRREERITLGYTDERGRILLNPSVCFSAYHSLGPQLRASVSERDLVPTLATLYHEVQHRFHDASEEQAYEHEWRLLKRLEAHCRARRPVPHLLLAELRDWEGQMPARIESYVGAPGMAVIRRRIEEGTP